MKPLLSVRDLSISFGGVEALRDIDFDVNPNTITALIGPNGAGKTTIFNCITGFYKANRGTIHLYDCINDRDGESRRIDLVELLGQPFCASDFINPSALFRRFYFKLFGGAHRVTRAGVVRTFQNIRLFKEMTVMENLLVAQRHRLDCNIISGLLQTSRFRRAEKEAVERAFDWLDFFEMREDANRPSGDLPYGHQRRLEIARAVCTDPRLICLDEPAAGLNPNETQELSFLIRALRDKHNITLFLIEHDMGLVMDISDHVVVLDHGEVIAQGTPDKVQNDARVLEAYLGVEEEGSF